MLTFLKYIKIKFKVKKKNIFNFYISNKQLENTFQDLFFDINFKDLTLIDIRAGPL